ncbi:CD3324 family protein [Clostridium botulinum]|uniref:Mor transcription activator domain-containing protein n=2 Tax=Clostridium botulinum TaxID=1491 RepID=A0A846I2P9_CLOBO|nr:CD3324 family protein [Clostridium botulinum]AJD28109.1 putative helix-turn-helix domain of resolvase [Clostridium botulinum CDC_297]EPS52551.1 hypothetical protein CFSAN002368_06960 [Clostridium botulinum A1 str. CFSAN002368]ACQ54031.1 conserved hypothetical protein [Clostridium botulinum Ba4 str. 657]AJE11484.1 putative helix-turn-helix domain of resolvase [Clostridium botulinum CDC_1436]APU59544.1 hypothetical protein NPD8_1503 [Clostridium botulinum]
MKYLNANKVLPDFLVKELQNYVQGDYLYVPIEKDKHKKWGELSGCRNEIEIRNQEIIDKHMNGASIEELSDTYYLSIHAVRKIIYKK